MASSVLLRHRSDPNHLTVHKTWKNNILSLKANLLTPEWIRSHSRAHRVFHSSILEFSSPSFVIYMKVILHYCDKNTWGTQAARNSVCSQGSTPQEPVHALRHLTCSRVTPTSSWRLLPVNSALSVLYLCQVCSHTQVQVRRHQGACLPLELLLIIFISITVDAHHSDWNQTRWPQTSASSRVILLPSWESLLEG